MLTAMHDSQWMNGFGSGRPGPETGFRGLGVGLADLARRLATGLTIGAAGFASLAAEVVPSVPTTPPSPALSREMDNYRICATLNLPSDFGQVKDSSAAVAVAMEKCQKQRHAVAGQFALDNPGTVHTRGFIDGLTVQLMHELSRWLDDVGANRVPPHPTTRRQVP